jgi:hypothetical protein
MPVAWHADDTVLLVAARLNDARQDAPVPRRKACPQQRLRVVAAAFNPDPRLSTIRYTD